MGRFQDQVVWITGASAGIGRELARQLADEGAQVAVSARREDRLHAVVADIEARGRQGLAVACDVTDEQAVARAADLVVEHFGRLDVAIANAGFGVVGPIEELSAEDWRRQFDVNVVGLAITVRHALPHLRKTAGRMVLIGSVASMVTRTNTGPYSASKAAVRMIGHTLAMELHGSDVSSITIHPGFVESDIARTDNEGVYHPDAEDPRPAKLMWPTDRAARAMLHAIHKRKREYVFTGHGKFFGFLARHWPALMHFIGTRVWMPKR